MEKAARRPVQLSDSQRSHFRPKVNVGSGVVGGDDLALARLSFRACAINIDETRDLALLQPRPPALGWIDSLRDSFSRGTFHEEKWVHDQAAESR
jgi:hypothetical protein